MLISVTIPVYNSEAYIDRCIEVLSNQTCKEFEVVFVVDDRCIDNSMNKLRSIQDTPFPIIIVNQSDNERLSGARNIGIDSVSGKYIWFMDVDDCPCNTFIEEMIALMNRTDCDIAMCNFCYSYSNDDYFPPQKEYKVTEFDGIEAMISMNKGSLPIVTWDKMLKTSFIKENDIRFVNGFSEDYQFAMDVFLKTDKIVYYNKPLYVYNLHENSLSDGRGDLIAERDIEIFTEIAGKVKTEKPEHYEEFCASGLIHILRSLTNTSRKAFLELSKSSIIKESLGYKQKQFSAEIFLFKLSKRLFHFTGKIARKLKFSRKNILFDSDI